jgi:PAS domain S-box-containing protein
VDALVVNTTEGDQLFTLSGADKPYRLFFEGMAEGALTVLPDGSILSANPRMLDLAKMSLSTLVGTPFERLFEEETSTSLHALLRVKTPTMVPVEVTLHTGDGSDVAVALTASSLNLDGLRVNCILVTDITERRKAQESEHFHSALLAAAGEAIVVTDAVGHITFMNRAAEHQYGWTSEEVLGRLIVDTLPSEYAGEDASWVVGAAQAGQTWSGEFSVQHRMGQWIAVFGTVTPVFGDDGELLALIGITSDITERKKAEAARDASAQWFRSLIQHSSDIILVVDTGGAIRYASPSASAVLGYETDDLIGTALESFIHPEDLSIRDEAIAQVEELPLGAAAPLLQLRFRHASGEWRWLESVATNLLDEASVRGVVINCRDVTEKVNLSRAFQTLSRANQVLVRAASEESLLSDLCRTVVESGYPLAWVGFADKDDARAALDDGDAVATPESRRIMRVAAAAGETSFIPQLEVAWGGDEYRFGPMATALETSATQIVNDVLALPFDSPWRVQAEKHGFRSACALPLSVDGAVIGAVNIYSRSSGAFDEQSVGMLEELSANLAYGIGRMRERMLLGEREALLREAEQLAHAGHWRWTPATGDVEFLADEIFKIYGITREAWAGTPNALLAVVPDDERPNVASALARSAAGEVVEWFNSVVRPNGDVRQIRTRTSVLRDTEGRIKAVLGACVDYTEHAASRKSLLFQAQLLDNAGQAIVAADNGGVVTYWNRAAESMFGWPGSEALGQPIADVLPSDVTSEQSLEALAVLETGGTWHGDLTVRRRDGNTVQVSVTDTPSVDADGAIAGVIRVASDVSERRALELRLNQAQRLESLGLLAGGIAHDFNNLLTVVLNYASIIERDADGKVRQHAHQIVSAGEAAARLIRQLLTFARREPTHAEELDLNEVVVATKELLARTIGEHIRLTLRIGPAATVLIDRGRLEQVVVNLAVNASEAMPAGGNLSIDTSVVELDEGFAMLHPGVTPGPYGQIVVSDTGEGMSPDVMAHAFDPFYSTKGLDGGTGLGLATVYGIAQEAGGQVYLYSEVGVGTTVRVYLPLFDTHELARPLLSERSPRVGEGATILVVENQDLVRAVACDLIRENGYEVLEAASPADAIELAAANQIDLLLTDVIMPEMSGPALVALLAPTHPGLPIVYMSGYSADFLGVHGDLDADVILVQKPFNESTLIQAIGVAFGRIASMPLVHGDGPTDLVSTSVDQGSDRGGAR